VQAHTLGEVDILDTVLLRVSFGIGTILPSFIEIGSYLTEKKEKISWQFFFETRCTTGALTGTPGDLGTLLLHSFMLLQNLPKSSQTAQMA